VTIELFGIARLRAGRAWLEVDATTVAEALSALGDQCPDVVPEVIDGGCLTRHFMVSLNGGPFRLDPNTSLDAGDTLMILGNQAGG
jgi:molybdopterin converting factor small subunit